jgi:hypothetical protein
LFGAQLLVRNSESAGVEPAKAPRERKDGVSLYVRRSHEESLSMSRGPHTFKYRDAMRLLRSYGAATGADPADVILEKTRDGTLRVTTKSAEQKSQEPTDEWKLPDEPDSTAIRS